MPVNINIKNLKIIQLIEPTKKEWSFVTNALIVTWSDAAGLGPFEVKSVCERCVSKFIQAFIMKRHNIARNLEDLTSTRFKHQNSGLSKLKSLVVNRRYTA